MRVFACRLNELKNNMTIVDFAKKCGISRATMGFYLDGVREPSAGNIQKICTRLNVSSDWILGLTDLHAPSKFDLMTEKTQNDLALILESPKRDKILSLCAEVLRNEQD